TRKSGESARPRVPASAARHRELFFGAQLVAPLEIQRKACFGATPKPDTRDACAPKNQLAEMTHTLEGDRPENRLSYMGATCVAGQRKVPAAGAPARIQYGPEPGAAGLTHK